MHSSSSAFSVEDMSFYNFLDTLIIPIEPLSILFSDYSRPNAIISYDFFPDPLITGFYTIIGGFVVLII